MGVGEEEVKGWFSKAFIWKFLQWWKGKWSQTCAAESVRANIQHFGNSQNFPVKDFGNLTLFWKVQIFA